MIARFHLRRYLSGQARRAIFELSSQAVRIGSSPYRSSAPFSAARSNLVRFSPVVGQNSNHNACCSFAIAVFYRGRLFSVSRVAAFGCTPPGPPTRYLPIYGAALAQVQEGFRCILPNRVLINPVRELPRRLNPLNNAGMPEPSTLDSTASAEIISPKTTAFCIDPTSTSFP